MNNQTTAINTPKYLFARSKLTIVHDLKQLGPAYPAEVGSVYHAFHWNRPKEDYTRACTAVYMGDGLWLDPDDYTDLSAHFNWAAYLVKKK